MMKKAKILHLTLLACVLLLPFGCNDKNDNPLLGNWKPVGAKINFTPYASQATAIDQMIAQICIGLGMEPITLQTANAMLSVLSTQQLTQSLEAINIIDEGNLSFTAKDGTSATVQYSVKEDKFTVAIPSEIAGLPLNFPFQCKYAVSANNLMLFLDKESLNEMVSNPLFELLFGKIAEESGGMIDLEGIKRFLSAMESVEISVSLTR